MNTGAYHASKWALEGFSQSLAHEVADFGVKVTLIEPAGYSTDWSGSSAKHSAQLPAYDEDPRAGARIPQGAVRQAGRPDRDQAGDPHAGGQRNPPLRLFLGESPLGIATADYESRLAAGANGSRWPSPPRASPRAGRSKPFYRTVPAGSHPAQFPSTGG